MFLNFLLEKNFVCFQILFELNDIGKMCEILVIPIIKNQQNPRAFFR